MGRILRAATAFLLGALLPGSVLATQLDRPVTAWPIFVRQATADTAETDILWPLFHYERNRTYEQYAARPFFFSRETDPSRDFEKTSVLWPISEYRREGNDISYHLFPVYWYRDAPRGRYTVLFPVYWNGESDDRSYFHIWPFYGIDRQAGITEHSLLYPFFRYERDSETGDTEINAPWPFVQYRRGEGFLSWRFLPFSWYGQTASETNGFIVPYFWHTGPGREARGVFPLWYSSKQPGGRIDLVVPLYFRRRSDDQDVQFITPLFFHRKTADGETQALFPISYRSDGPDSRTRYIFPSYFSTRSSGRRFMTVFPFYYDISLDDARLQAAVPLALRYRTSSTDLSLLFPFYYKREDRVRGSTLTYFFPFYGRYRRGEAVSRYFVFFPLYSRYRDEETHSRGWDAVWPLLHHESSPLESETRVLPFFWEKSSPDEAYTIGFPLYWSFRAGDSSITHLIPFYGKHSKGHWFRRQFVFGPLYMKTRDDHADLLRRDVLFPLFSRSRAGKENREWALPFYFHRDSPGSSLTLASAAFLPPYYVNSSGRDREVFHIWPFYGSIRRGTYREHSVLWPLVRVGDDPEKHEHLTHVILYYGTAKGADRADLLFPVWRHCSTAAKTVDASLFLHWYERDAAGDRTFLSLFWLAPPDLGLFLYKREPGAVTHRVFPLYSYSSDRRTDLFKWSVLWPLFSESSQGEFVRQSDVLWKLVTYERKDAQTSDLRVMGRLIRSAKTSTASVFEFNPFYYYEKEEGKGSYWAVLGGLVGVETRGDGKRYRFFWFF